MSGGEVSLASSILSLLSLSFPSMSTSKWPCKASTITRAEAFLLLSVGAVCFALLLLVSLWCGHCGGTMHVMEARSAYRESICTLVGLVLLLLDDDDDDG